MSNVLKPLGAVKSTKSFSDFFQNDCGRWLGLLAWVLSLAHSVPSEAQNCARVDLRPWLEKVGLPIDRHQGGRLDATSLMISEAASLVLKKPVSARSVEHAVASAANPVGSLSRELSAEKPSPRFSKALRQPVCLEADVPSEDIESTRHARLRYLAQSLKEQNLDSVGATKLSEFANLFQSESYARASDSPLVCRSQKVRMPAFIRTTNSAQFEKELDRNFDLLRLPIIIEKSETESPKALVARRLSVDSGLCEYLSRDYEGGSCATLDDKSCEDGSHWISRETLLEKTKAIWSVK